MKCDSRIDNRHDLNVILSSRVPIVVVETLDEKRFLDMLGDLVHGAFGGRHQPLFRWSVTEGLRRLDIDMGTQLHNAEPTRVLKHIHAVESADGSRKVVLVSHELRMPPELEQLAARFEMSLPDSNERTMIVARTFAEWNKKNPGSVEIDPQAQALLVRNLSGLTRAETERLAHGAIFADGAITTSDLPEVMKAKYELLNRHGVLSFQYETAHFSDVGGLGHLKTWLEQRRAGRHARAATAQGRHVDWRAGVRQEPCGESCCRNSERTVTATRFRRAL